MADGMIAFLQQYEQERRSKKAVLLTPGGGYYLYENRFCRIRDFDLTVTGPGVHIQGSSVPCGLFFGLTGDLLLWSAAETGSFSPHRLSLIFHILLDGENDLLRGILFAQGKNAYLSLFTDAETEKLYRAVSSPVHPPPPTVCIGDDLAAYAAACAGNDLHRLTALYLHGQKLSQLRREVEQA
ncbi:MAG: hypothetical protein K2O18_07710 [Oscillospiraceae bacterium]|nr:hypothetical protein [Oscillospiraceae bacterium]